MLHCYLLCTANVVGHASNRQTLSVYLSSRSYSYKLNKNRKDESLSYHLGCFHARHGTRCLSLLEAPLLYRPKWSMPLQQGHNDQYTIARCSSAGGQMYLNVCTISSEQIHQKWRNEINLLEFPYTSCSAQLGGASKLWRGRRDRVQRFQQAENLKCDWQECASQATRPQKKTFQYLNNAAPQALGSILLFSIPFQVVRKVCSISHRFLFQENVITHRTITTCR